MSSTYYSGSTNAGGGDIGVPLDFRKFLEVQTETATEITLSWAAGPIQADLTGLWITRAFVPAAPAWPTGDYTVEINVTDGDNDITAEVRLHRFDSSGTLLESSAYGASFSCRIPGVKTTTFSSEAWSSGSYTDRLGVEFVAHNGSVNAREIKIGTGTTSEEAVTPIIQGTVLRVPPIVVSHGAVPPSADLSLSIAPSPAATSASPVALALALALILAPTATAAQIAAQEPTLDHGTLTLAMEAVAAALGSEAPTLDLALSLAPDALAAVLAATDPTLGLAVNLAPDAASAAIAPVDPSLSMALSLSPTPASVAVSANDAGLDLILALAVDAVSAALTAPAVTLDLGAIEEVAGCLESVVKAVRDRYRAQVEIVEGVATLHDDEPPEDMDGADAWVRLSITAEPAEQTTLGGVPGTRYYGTASARVFLRLGIGDSDAWALADAINDAFRGVTASGVIYSPPPFPILRARSGERWEIEVAIPFYADCVEAAT